MTAAVADCTLVLHRHDEVIGTSALASAAGKPCLQRRQFFGLAAPLQAFHQPVQRPAHCSGAGRSAAPCRSGRDRRDRPARLPARGPGREAAPPAHGAAGASTPMARCRTDCRQARPLAADGRRPRHAGPGDRQARHRARRADAERSARRIAEETPLRRNALPDAGGTVRARARPRRNCAASHARRPWRSAAWPPSAHRVPAPPTIGSSMISCQRPKRTSTCDFIA